MNFQSVASRTLGAHLTNGFSLLIPLKKTKNKSKNKVSIVVHITKHATGRIRNLFHFETLGGLCAVTRTARCVHSRRRYHLIEHRNKRAQTHRFLTIQGIPKYLTYKINILHINYVDANEAQQRLEKKRSCCCQYYSDCSCFSLTNLYPLRELSSSLLKCGMARHEKDTRKENRGPKERKCEMRSDTTISR